MLQSAFLASIALSLAAAGPAFASASNNMGTAGLYRSLPMTNCGQPILAQMEGACDPPPVDTNLAIADQVQAHLGRAERLLLLMRMQQAREAADRALELEPGNFAVLKFRARLALNMWDDSIAWHDINAALKIMPDDSDLLATKAELRWRRQEIELALEDAAAAINLNPKNADAFRSRGRMLMQMGRTTEALHDWNAALALEPDLKLARLFRAQTYLRMANFNAAIEDASTILRDNPADMSGLQVRAYAYGAVGKLAEAAGDLTTLLGKPGDGRASPAGNGTFRPLLLQRMIIFVKLGREREAEQDIDMLLSGGGKPGVLQLQLFLRQNGFPEVQLDGQRSTALDQALRACVTQQTCLRGLSERI